MLLLHEQTIGCPYCGETIDILIDTSIEQQSYIEDCQVCCRPINLVINQLDEDQISVDARRDDE